MATTIHHIANFARTVADSRELQSEFPNAVAHVGEHLSRLTRDDEVLQRLPDPKLDAVQWARLTLRLLEAPEDKFRQITSPHSGPESSPR